MEGDFVLKGKEYSTVVLDGLPPYWFSQGTGNTSATISEASKRNVLNPGYTVLQESYSDETTGSSILKVSGMSLPGHQLRATSLASTATLIYKESITVSLAFQDSSHNNLVEMLARNFNLDFGHQQNNIYRVTGSLDTIVDFRRQLDRDILLNHRSSPNVHDNQLSGASSRGAEAVSLPAHSQFPRFKYEYYKNQNADILDMLNKLPDGQIPGVHYLPREGVVCIEKEDLADKISKFQRAYQGITEKLKMEVVAFPDGCSVERVNEVLGLFAKEYATYSQCVFICDESVKSVKIISVSSRQFEQAKKILLERCRVPECLTFPISQGRVLTLKKSDIVKESVDIIVNAANGKLQHAGGVALAIDKASHGAVQQHSNSHMKKLKYKEIKVGNVVYTKAGGSLKCRYIIHAVGPTKDYYDCKSTLKRLTQNILRETEKLEAASIAIPAISSGIFGVDKNLVAHCVVESILSFKYSASLPTLSDIRIVIIDEPTYRCFAEYIQKRSPPTKKVCSTGAKDSPGEESVGLQSEGAVKDDDDGRNVDTATETVGKMNEECSHLINLLDSMDLLHLISKKWNILAYYLGLSNDTISKIFAKSGDKMKLECMIREWWKANGRLDIVKFIKCLEKDEINERLLAAELNRVYFMTGANSEDVKSSSVPPDKAAVKESKAAVKESEAGLVPSQHNHHDVGSGSATKSPLDPPQLKLGSSGENPVSSSVSSSSPPPLPPGFSYSADKPTMPPHMKEPVGTSPPQKLNGGVQCPICFEDFKDQVETKCGHKYCFECIHKVVTKQHQGCPMCRADPMPLRGKQPDGGTIRIYNGSQSLPGYPDCGTIVIEYNIPGGDFPAFNLPGFRVRLEGVSMRAFLPSTGEGHTIAKLLEKAFYAGLTFSVLINRWDVVITWNGITHKTHPIGEYGWYPDPGYLERVRKELEAKGIN